MKRFLLLSILLIISVLLAFSLSSCGEVEDGGTTPPATDSSGGVIAPDLVGGMKDSFVDTALTLDRLLSAYRYTVTFDSNGGTAIPAVKAREGGVIYSPRVPQKKNSVLVGWYLGERKWSFDTDTVTEDITLVARWERAPHTDGLRFSRDEGGYYVSGYDGTDCEVYFSPTHEGLPVVGIADFAFRKNAALQSVAIPSGVEKIGQMAFEGCTSLESISLPDTVTTIGKRAFSGCTSLEGLTLPSSVSSIGERALGSEGGTPFNVYLSDAEQWLSLTAGGIAIVNGSYRLHVGGTPLADLVIPEEVDKIGHRAFCGCVSLERVSALGELEEIGLWAFAECTELVSVALPDSVTKIGVGAFEGCTSLASFNIPAGVATLDGAEFNGCTSLATVTLSPSLTHIGKSVFDGCSSLSSITLHEGIESIGEHAFRGCAELVTLAVPSTVTAIGREAFIGCTGLTTLTVSEGVGEIGYSAFAGCSSLRKVTLPFVGTKADGTGSTSFSSVFPITVTDVTLIGDADIPEGAFTFCTGIRTLTVGDGIGVIGVRAFANCVSLTDVTLGASVRILGDYSFASCPLLESIRLPESVESIGVRAFYSCTRLKNLIIRENVTAIGANAFGDCSAINRISFLDEEGWYATESVDDWESMTGGTAVDVTDTAENKNIFTQENVYWYKL